MTEVSGSPDDLLDPHRLALITPWSFITWRQALAMARTAGVHDWQLRALVRGGATPHLIAFISKYLP